MTSPPSFSGGRARLRAGRLIRRPISPRPGRLLWAGTVALALMAAACAGSDASWSRAPHVEAVFGGEGRKIMVGVAEGGPGLVAVGAVSTNESDAAVWVSEDGIGWSQVDDPAALAGVGDQAMRAVMAGGPGLVAVGDAESGTGSDAAVWTSEDGTKWSRVFNEQVLGGERDQVMWHVAAGGPGLVAVGGEGFDAAVWTSSDGTTWSRLPHDEVAFGSEGRVVMRSVVAAGPGLVAVGAEEIGLNSVAAVWTSPDGLTWSRVPHDEAVFGGDGFQAMFAVATGGPGLVAVGGEQSDDGSDAAVWTSEDGVTWSRVAGDVSQLGGAGNQVMFGVTADESGLVAVGASPGPERAAESVWVSSDGFLWTRVAVEDGAGPDGVVMFSVSRGGPGFVAVGQEAISDDSFAAVWVSGG